MRTVAAFVFAGAVISIAIDASIWQLLAAAGSFVAFSIFGKDERA